jgi:hypothetical protein
MGELDSRAKTKKSALLEPEYEPDGIVNNISTALGLVKQSDLRVPRPSSPMCNLKTWRRVIDMMNAEVIEELGEKIETHDLSNAFKTLSLKLDDCSTYQVDDIIKVKTTSEVSDEKSSKEHIKSVFRYVVEKLPPVTAALVGGYLSEVRIYGQSEYHDDILPDGKKYGGLHRPYRRCIEIVDRCSSRIHKNPKNYPCYNSSWQCIFLHELGHTVHNIYGFLRPGDGGYDYPSSEDEIESTGCINPINLSKIQSQFVYDMFRTYVYNHMDCYNNVYKYGNYGQQHPTESFACAFEVLLRNGERKIMDEYWHFRDVFTHLY